MPDLNKIKQFGEELDTLLQLRTSSLAVRMLEKEEDIPENAVRPKRDLGKHVAQCQAFALSRRKEKTIAVLKEDNWCWAPLLSFGLVEIPEFFMEGKAFFPFFVEDPGSAAEIAKNFPRFKPGKYIGIVSSPLKLASFSPDMVMIYCNNSQLRTILLAVKFKEGKLITSHFDPIDSCVYSVVPVILNREYRITLPDPGDYQRALADEDEIIFSLPIEKLENLVLGLRHFEKKEHGYRNFTKEMQMDFPQPPFYLDLFKKWGLDSPK
jgi:uncharacterized protein (DUF169 family)